MEEYFESLATEISKAYERANSARKKGYDPEIKVDIPLARNMAERVEGLISAIAPEIVGKGIPARIEELEKEYGALAWQVALIIAEEVASEKFCKFSSKKEAMEIGIRTGFAYHTVGVVAAPLEGFVELRIKRRNDGKEYLAASFAGPIRGAGGTAAGVCVIITDYIRRRMGYEAYDPTENEVNRFIAELYDYHERITNLQYKPSPEEIAFLVRNVPIEIDGDPSEDIEVSNYKDLPRVATNKIRSGVCLVVSMLALKAPKLWKELREWGTDFEIDWSFLSQYLIMKKQKASKKTEGLVPDFTFISDLVAGRPVLTYPLSVGGFRLRYGKTRMSGYSSCGLHPATMIMLDSYIATGTQLKTERPGKAAAVTPADSIDGPIVKLNDGSVIKLDSETFARKIRPQIEEVLFLGDILVSYGEFFDRAQQLVPAGYCEEWHVQEIEEAAKKKFLTFDLAAISKEAEIGIDELTQFIEHPFLVHPSAKAAMRISRALDVALHPAYTNYWNAITGQELAELAEYLASGTISNEDGKKIIMPISSQKRLLELCGVPHMVANNEFVVLSGEQAEIISEIFQLENFSIAKFVESVEKKPLDILNLVSPVRLRDKCGTFVGARMGRPEKAKMRALTGSPHCLFPVGSEGGRLRSVQAALQEGKIIADFGLYFCEVCRAESIYSVCSMCDGRTRKYYHCKVCGNIDTPTCAHGPALGYKRSEIKIRDYFQSSLRTLGTKSIPDLIKGVKGTANKDHIAENLVKGILRAMHEITVNKDGTTRYDMTELPLTHFRPFEILTSVQKLRELGYTKDIYGKELEDPGQIVELFAQDVILPTALGDESADAVLKRVADFVDDELVHLYSEEPYYIIKSREDLVGQLVIGLAPHISAGIIGRIIGFSKTQTLLAHPLYHAAMRRDADGDEACVMLLLDALLNFSRQFLPDTRGAKTMDAPHVLTSKLIPAEVDDMVHRFDVSWRYPLEFYLAALLMKMPWDVKIELIGDRIGKPTQYCGVGYTHELTDMNSGIAYSAYKKLPSMEEKLKGQMILAEKIRAVDARDVAKLVIEKHLLRDIKGNLRKFGTQQFRCVKCNKKFRRPPLLGICECKGKLLFTVSEGAIIKYLGPAVSLAEKYDVSPYLKQTLVLTRKRVEEVFGRDKEKQEGLGKWFG